LPTGNPFPFFLIASGIGVLLSGALYDTGWRRYLRTLQS